MLFGHVVFFKSLSRNVEGVMVFKINCSRKPGIKSKKAQYLVQITCLKKSNINHLGIKQGTKQKIIKISRIVQQIYYIDSQSNRELSKPNQTYLNEKNLSGFFVKPGIRLPLYYFLIKSGIYPAFLSLLVRFIRKFIQLFYLGFFHDFR